MLYLLPLFLGKLQLCFGLADASGSESAGFFVEAEADDTLDRYAFASERFIA